MFLSGNADEQRASGPRSCEGYNQFGAIEYRELRLVEPLRARAHAQPCRLGRRALGRSRPSRAPSRGPAEARFWEGYVGDLMQQREALELPPLLAGNL